MNFLKLLDPATVIAQEAGELILKIYSTKFDVKEKDDMSPLTLADTTSHRYITHCLQKLTPEILGLLVEKYPDGYDDDQIIAFKNAKNETIEAVEVKTEDTIYLVKVSTRLENTMANFDEDDYDDSDYNEPIVEIPEKDEEEEEK